jgi:branched-chain amino acid aminotransferase
MYVYLNGEILPEQDARIPVTDRGFLLGDGVFETMRVYDGHVFRMKRHIERLFHGCERLGILPDMEEGQIGDSVIRLLQKNGHARGDAIIRITVSRGSGGRGIDTKGASSPTVLITSSSYSPLPEEAYLQGVRAVLSRSPISFRGPGDGEIKPISFLPYILQRLDHGGEGIFEVIMQNHEGYITEGTVSNIFFVKEGVLHTPSPETGLLKGVTREVVMEIARDEGIPVREGFYRPEDLLEAQEAFITNSIIEVMPLSSVDDRVLEIGTVSRKIRRLYQNVAKT